MKRFPAFGDDQAREVATEFDRVERRMMTLLVILATSIAVGLGAGLFVYQHEQSAANHASCDATARLAGVLQIALPRHPVAGRSKQQQRNIDRFYRAIDKQHLLNPPGC